MNNTSEVVTLSAIGLIWVAPVKNGWLWKWQTNKIYESTVSSNISNFWL